MRDLDFLIYLPKDILQMVLETIPYRDMTRLLSVNKLLYHVYKERENLIYLHRLKREYPRYPLIREFKTHYQNIVMNRGNNYCINFISEDEMIDQITNVRSGKLDDYSIMIKTPGNPYPEKTIIYTTTLKFNIMAGYMLDTCNIGFYGTKKPHTSFSIEDARKNIIARFLSLSRKIAQSKIDFRVSFVNFTMYKIDPKDDVLNNIVSEHIDTPDIPLLEVLPLLEKLDGLIIQHILIVSFNNNYITIGLHEGILPPSDD